MILSEKETGENPVRARRREVQKGVFFLLLCRKAGQAIEYILRR